MRVIENIKLVTHISKHYICVFDGQFKYKINLKKENL